MALLQGVFGFVRHFSLAMDGSPSSPPREIVRILNKTADVGMCSCVTLQRSLSPKHARESWKGTRVRAENVRNKCPPGNVQPGSVSDQ